MFLQSLLQQHAPGDSKAMATEAAAAAASSPVFWGILIGYFVVVLGFGSYFARFNRSTTDFFFGGRRFAWWLITMSIVATGVGSHSFIKYSGKSFEHGFSGSMAYMNDWFFMPLFIFGWLPIVYYMKVRSIPEYFERRFNPTVRVLATIVQLVYMIGYVGIGFLTMARTLEPIVGGALGWELMEIIWVVAVVAGLYITFGGQTAVIFTDLLQGFILLLAGVMLFMLGLDWFGGFDAFWSILPDEFKLPLANFNEDPSFNFIGVFWQDAIAGSIAFLFMSQALIMRFMACRSVDHGRKAATFNVLFALPISAVAVCCAGWIGRGMVLTDPGVLPSDVAPDNVFVLVVQVLTSTAGFGFFVAAVTAALMSSVDTYINATAAIAINDVYRPILKLLKIERDDKHYLRVAMIVSALGTALGVGAAWMFSQFKDLYTAHAFFQSTISPPLVACIFLGIFWRRFTSAGAVATFVGGVGLIVLGRFFPYDLIEPFAQGIPRPEGDAQPYTYIGALYNLLVCFGIGILVSLFTRPKPEGLEGLTIWSIKDARRYFKGGEPNDRKGFKLPMTWEVDDTLDAGTVQVDQEGMHHLAANEGDLVYVCDKRWWLGGLRSAHGKLHGLHGLGETVRIAPDILEAAFFLEGKLVTIEKEF
ncbi:MAG: sodium/solute symporter [Planctomycetota bacterium]|nr:sodium/solute symporter [Planctomycetota bacterium]MDA1112695.1 sodium/solute symporter [Planctomycetota bacterium]